MRWESLVSHSASCWPCLCAYPTSHGIPWKGLYREGQSSGLTCCVLCKGDSFVAMEAGSLAARRQSGRLLQGRHEAMVVWTKMVTEVQTESKESENNQVLGPLLTLPSLPQAADSLLGSLWSWAQPVPSALFLCRCLKDSDPLWTPSKAARRVNPGLHHLLFIDQVGQNLKTA